MTLANECKQRRKMTNLCKGKKHKRSAYALVESVLKPAYEDCQRGEASNPNLQEDDSTEVPVQFKWTNKKTLEITGRNKDRGGILQTGTTMKALMELVSHNKQFEEKNTRNAIDLLKSVHCLKNQGSHSTDTNQYIMEETSTESLKSQGIRVFKLKLKGEDETLVENLKYFKECISKEYGEFPYDIEDENTSINQDPEKLEELLSSLDCEKQKDKFKNNIDLDRNIKKIKRVFLIHSNYEKAYDWYLWSLSKHLRNSDNAKKIIINIDVQVRRNFDNFWEKFAEYIGLNKNVNRQTIIKKLINLYQTKSIIIVIKNYPDSFLSKLSEFWSELFNQIISISNDKKLRLVIFLLSEVYETTENNENQENPTSLEFGEIPEKEVNDWLDLKENIYKKSDYDWKAGHEHLGNFGKHPYHLIDDICKYVLKLNNGIAEVERYWKNFS